ncbi:RecA-like recombination protein [Serratia phage X20]|uniref:RecA-like recombination protein n=3 Tax=Winklervirus TaxID=2560256 RepID=A0A1Z1LYU9_9CAUD|nr:DNA repair protein [Serratia phage CHI14]YP_010092184.1 DNA repair protein [Serratia phage X20]ARW57732.1 RecA-like recombination protein [Serratia phage CBH8]QYN80479.1 recombination protein [Kosakonia phage Kc304]UJJ22016.1 recombination and repair protein [Erwinia phage Virsaitis27]UYM28686.1 RecA-like recombination protein [Serratia phage vB_SspM_LC53]ARW57457.1 RecA-like recombination protein [Serratia phage CHI14]
MALADLKSRLIKASTSKMTAELTKSKFFNDKDVVRTKIPMLNIAISGALDGGMQSGLTIFAGPSKHFKSNMGLTMVSAYMNKYPEAICLFYDSEFGISEAYLRAMKVDPERVIHTPIQSVEQLKIDMVNQLEAIERGEKVIIFIDSIGNMASKKETEDALNEKTVADMTRAKQLKSLFRIVTPFFSIKDIPCVAVNHTIETMEMFSKTVMTGGTGVMYSADTVFIIGKRQIKDGTELQGFQFVLNAEKSRAVKEKSKFFIDVKFDGGIDPYSGLLEMALELGFVVKPKNGWYSREFLDVETGEMVREEKSWRAKDTSSTEFWGPMFKHEPFRDAIKRHYQLGAIDSNATVDAEVEDLISSKVEKFTAPDVPLKASAADIETELDDFAG